MGNYKINQIVNRPSFGRFAIIYFKQRLICRESVTFICRICILCEHCSFNQMAPLLLLRIQPANTVNPNASRCLAKLCSNPKVHHIILNVKEFNRYSQQNHCVMVKHVNQCLTDELCNVKMPSRKKKGKRSIICERITQVFCETK